MPFHRLSPSWNRLIVAFIHALLFSLVASPSFAENDSDSTRVVVGPHPDFYRNALEQVKENMGNPARKTNIYEAILEPKRDLKVISVPGIGSREYPTILQLYNDQFPLTKKITNAEVEAPHAPEMITAPPKGMSFKVATSTAPSKAPKSKKASIAKGVFVAGLFVWAAILTWKAYPKPKFKRKLPPRGKPGSLNVSLAFLQDTA